MSDKFKDLNDTFDVEAEIVKPEKEKKEITKPSESEDVTKDYEYTRGNLRPSLRRDKRRWILRWNCPRQWTSKTI